MFIGEYTHNLDTKNRISLPFKFRKDLGRKVIITPGLENCLFIFNVKEWSKVRETLSGGPGLSFLSSDQRSFNRFLFGRAAEAEVDKVGRILIPDFLKDRAGLKDEAVFVGVEDRVEIWNKNMWQEYRTRVEKQADELAEKIAKGK